MTPLDLVQITGLMERSSGSSDVKIGLIDGPVASQHPDLTDQQLREIPGNSGATCTQALPAWDVYCGNPVCQARVSGTCHLPQLQSPDTADFRRNQLGPRAHAERDARRTCRGNFECIKAGARVINLSLALAQRSIKGEQVLEQALGRALKRGVIVVAAAGNQGAVGSSAITRHPWVIPVVACDLAGRTMNESNLGGSLGRRGLSAPGDNVTSLGAGGRPLTLGGTSAAAPFVTGAIALLWSEFTAASAAQIKLAVTQAGSPRRTSVIPPLLDAMTAFQALSLATERRRMA
jgi:subtilisin family serine protease